MKFRLCIAALLLAAGVSHCLAQCANCGQSGQLYFGPEGSTTPGPGGVPVWTPRPAASCGHCGHTSEQEFMMYSCNDCLFNWGEEYSEVNALTPRFAPLWNFTFDATFLARDPFNHIPFQAYDSGGPPVLGTDQFPLEFRSGVRAKASRALSDTWRFEGVYLGQSSWDHVINVRDITPNDIGGLGVLTSPFTNFGFPLPVPGLDYNTLAEISYSSNLENFELNLLHREGLICHAFETAFVCGVRYLKIDESFWYGTESVAPGILSAINIANTETANELIGGQLGVLGGYKVTDWCFFDFELKVAMCQNQAEQTTRYVNVNTVNGFLTPNASRTHDGSGNLAVVGDLNFTANFIVSDGLSLRMGYYAMFVDGLALAHENLTRDFGRLTLGPGFLDHNGSVVYHGPHLGLTLNW